MEAAQIDDLVGRFAYQKVNLVHEDGLNEGVWVLPISDEDKELMFDDTSHDAKISVVLCNDPLGWGATRYGHTIVARTRGEHRPEALLEDQIDELRYDHNPYDDDWEE